MGATLADGGVNPRTGKRVIAMAHCRRVLAVMATAGLYEESGEWLYEVGLPGKSGVSGGIVTVSPGQGRPGHLLPAARRPGQQRARPVAHHPDRRGARAPHLRVGRAPGRRQLRADGGLSRVRPAAPRAGS